MNLMKLGVTVLLFSCLMSACSNDDQEVSNQNELTELENLQKELEVAKERIVELEGSNSLLLEMETKVKAYELEKLSLEANKKLVTGFYQEVLGDLNAGAVDKYIGDVYVQHHFGVPDGKQALKQLVGFIKTSGGTPETINVETVFAQDDLVFVQILSKNGKNRTMDVFRLKDNLLVEHWDAFTKVD